MKWKYFIDSQKGLTFLVVIIMITIFHQWENPTALVYLALHGTYGIFWNIKSRVFPDRQWEKPVSWFRGISTWLGLCLFWVAPWLLTSGRVQAPAWLISLCIVLYCFGIFLNFTTDMQKYVRLKLQAGHLITDGMLARSRNMNYFGELLIYTGFGLLVMNWIPILILSVWITIVWIPFMVRKERSLKRYPEFTDYRTRSRFFIPFIY